MFLFVSSSLFRKASFSFSATGAPLIPVILYNDLRSSDIVKRWNNSFATRVLLTVSPKVIQKFRSVFARVRVSRCC